MDNTNYIYVYKHPITEIPFYIGRSSVKRRANFHLYETMENARNRLKFNTIQKIRRECKCDPIVEILIEDLTYEESLQWEKDLIQLIGRKSLKTGPLTNLTEGGEGVIGYKHTPEALEKLKKNSLGNSYAKGTKFSPEEIERRRKAAKDNAKTYLLKSPSGEIVSITNMSEFCRQNGLSKSGMSQVTTGRIRQNHGWSLP